MAEWRLAQNYIINKKFRTVQPKATQGKNLKSVHTTVYTPIVKTKQGMSL